MRRLFLFLLCLPLFASAQPENPLYWKNRKPHAAYWQQDVAYTIDARLDEEQHSIRAHQTLRYTNNSPDTLRFVYFHLFQNAFVEGSYLRKLQGEKKVRTQLGPREKAGLGTTISGISADGQAAQTELDNTILKVYLPQPLLPNSSTTLALDFVTYFDDKGTTRRRMKMYDAWGFKHYNGCQWFPKLAVYDAKLGWDTDQHLGKEFYGDFGTWNVSLDLPSNYILEATGALQNRSEVLPEALRQKLDLKNFKDKPWGEAPSTIIPYVKGARKVWKFRAENVHDFAWTADPSYRIATEYWNGVECVGIAQEPHASGWQNSAQYVAKIIKTFSEDFGAYAYPKMVAADAADGMEYPMITLDGGRDPGYRGLLVHEIGHNWFYGMVGSNETYRAAMDEGFTQFLTAWGLKKIDGESRLAGKPGGFWEKRGEAIPIMDRSVILPYTTTALNQNEIPLNTHSDDFRNAIHHENGYGMVYYKTATMLYTLQYVLGDSLFLGAMQHYFNQWKFAHPYFEDFRESVTHYTGQNLAWFFDEWFTTTKTIDYGICGVKKVQGTDSFDVKFRRAGQMQMPVQFTVLEKDNSRKTYLIPATWNTPPDAQNVLPRWIGWGQLQPSYTARIAAPSGIREVQIDTTYRLADIYYPDNSFRPGLGFGKGVATRLDWGFRLPPDRRHYRLGIRPDIWGNAVDGLKVGLHAEGDYLGLMHRFEATVWANTHVLQQDAYLSYQSEGYYDRYLPIAYNFSYASPVSRLYPKLQWNLYSRINDGMNRHGVGLSWQASERSTISGNFTALWRQKRYDLDYLLYPREWSSLGDRLNNSLNLAWNYTPNFWRGTGNLNLSLRAPFMTGKRTDAFDYGFVQGEGKRFWNWGKTEWRTRLFARYGMGENIPWESALFAASANPEALMENKFLRSAGFVPTDWTGYSATTTNHLQQGGGLNLRGYAGYLIAEEKDGQILLGYKSRSGAAFNAEMDFDGLVKFAPKAFRNWLHLDAYLFADAGLMELSRYDSLNAYANLTPANTWSSVRADAGLGVAMTIKKWGIFDKAKPLTVRFDMPFFLSHPPAGEDYFRFRYVVGIGRTFL